MGKKTFDNQFDKMFKFITKHTTSTSFHFIKKYLYISEDVCRSTTRAPTINLDIRSHNVIGGRPIAKPTTYLTPGNVVFTREPKNHNI